MLDQVALLRLAQGAQVGDQLALDHAPVVACDLRAHRLGRRQRLGDRVLGAIQLLAERCERIGEGGGVAPAGGGVGGAGLGVTLGEELRPGGFTGAKAVGVVGKRARAALENCPSAASRRTQPLSKPLRRETGR